MRISKKAVPAALTAMFIFSGPLKGIDLLKPINTTIDITGLFGLLLLAFLVQNFSTKRKISITQRTGYHLAALTLFSITITFSLLGNSISGNAQLKLAQFFAIGLSSIFFCIVFIKDSDTLLVFIKTLIAIGIISSANALHTTFFTQNSIEGYQWVSRISFIALLCSLSNFYRKSLKTQTANIINYSCIIPILFLSLFFAGARQAAFALIIVTFYYFYLHLKNNPARAKCIILITGSVALFLLMTPFLKLTTSDYFGIRGFDRILNFFILLIKADFNEILVMSGRSRLFIEAIKITSENPFFGVGFGNFLDASQFSKYDHPHNIFLEVLAETGIFGLSGLIIFLISFFIPLLRHNLSNVNSATTLLGLLTLGLFAMTLSSGDIGTNRAIFPLAVVLLQFYTQAGDLANHEKFLQLSEAHSKFSAQKKTKGPDGG